MIFFHQSKRNNHSYCYFSFILIFFLVFGRGVLAKDFVISDFSRHHFQSENVFFKDGALVFVPQKDDDGTKNHQGSVFYGFNSQKSLKTLDTSLVSLAPQGFLGQSVLFTDISNELSVPVPPAFSPDSSHYTGDFNFEIYLKPLSLTDGMKIIEGSSFVEGVYDHSYFEGFSLEIKNGNIAAHFENFFTFRDQKISFELVSKGIWVALGEWNHVQVRYQQKTGLVELLLNGDIVDFFYATVDGSPHSTGMFPGFRAKKVRHLQLGKKYLGYIDEFSVHNFVTRDISDATPPKILQNLHSFPASYTSRVFGLKPFSRIKKIDLQGDFLDFDNITVKICSLPHFFLDFEDNSQKKCRYMPVGKKIEGDEPSQYYQIFIDFFHKNRQKNVHVKKLVVHYDSDLPPAAPKLLRVESLGEKALLVWRKDFEKDIKGYNIYYSHKDVAVMGKNFKKKTIFLDVLRERAKKISPNAHHYFAFIDHLDLKKRYYFFITSFDYINSDGTYRESPRSEVVDVPVGVDKNVGQEVKADVEKQVDSPTDDFVDDGGAHRTAHSTKF